ncbi:MAG: right-handed parallel beta-helix repeat-containing protein [Pseudomonadota bacterium]
MRRKLLLRDCLLISLLVAVSTVPVLAATPAPAVLPQQTVDVAAVAATGATINVKAGDDFQMALERAQPGDVIVLEAGAEFRGPFVLPLKSGDKWIEIRSSKADQLPVDTRVTPAAAQFMPKLVASTESVLSTQVGAHHYRFVGIEIKPTRDTFLYNLVELGTGDDQLAQLPHHLIIDRCYLHGDAIKGTRRGIALNSAHTAVINSWLADFKEVGADSQAIAGWNGPGPFRIENNQLEGAGENVMFGGATPAIKGLVPADIEIRGNHFFKPLSWKADDASYEGKPWTVKNLFELKNARRVLIEGNVFEHNWPAAQNGFSILFTVRNEGGMVPWAAIEDVTFRSNLLRGIAAGINVLGHDDNKYPSEQTSRLDISNNLFADMGGRWGNGPLLQLLDGVTDLKIENNTALNGYSIVMTEGRPHTNVSFTHNIVVHNEYGIIGSGTSPGNPTLEQYFPSIKLDANVIFGGSAQRYPDGNSFLAANVVAKFIGNDSNELQLTDAHKLRSGKGSDYGVDFAKLCAALSPVEHSRYCHMSQALARATAQR